MKCKIFLLLFVTVLIGCSPGGCTKEGKICPDGSVVSRISPDCEFEECSEIIDEKPDVGFCTADVKECPDGSFVSRDVENNCEFKACPKVTEETKYGRDSWKEIIPDTCLRFFDGCNTCTRERGSELVACTKMNCFTYQKPMCIDPTPLGDAIIQNEEEEEMGTQVKLETSMGDIIIELEDDMPITTGNFEKLVSEGFYDGTIFHRVISGFMIQGGDPKGDGTGGPGYNIKDEFTDHNKNNRGTISMANAGPDTGGSQFFINLVNNNYLDPKHPVFGQVVRGMSVVDEIGKVKTGSGDRPVKEVKIIKAEII